MTDETPEEWRPVVGYEGLYEVSDLGRVKALARKRTHYSGVDSQFPEKIQAQTPNDSGHLITHLTSEKGKRSGKLVHRLVAEAFLGSEPEGKPLVLHWDDSPVNNHLSNLRWGNSSENQRDAIRNGLNPRANMVACFRGHEYTDDSTYWVKERTSRHCKICRDGWRERTDSETVHGALSSYTNRRCRCERCLNAHRVYKATGRVVTVKDAKENNND